MIAVRRFLAVLILLTCSGLAQAAGLESPRAASLLTNKVLERVVAGDFQGGLRLLEPHVVVPKAEFDLLLQRTTASLPEIHQRFGASLAGERIDDTRIGESVYRVRHLHKFERHVLLWTFIFYRPRDTWVLDTFWFDDKIHNLFGD